MATRGPGLVCESCGEYVRVYTLEENDGLVVGCGCEDIKHSEDSMPYEMGLQHVSEDWVSEPEADTEGVPTHFVVAELNGEKITTQPSTFQPPAFESLQNLEAVDEVENARVVSIHD